MINLMYTCLGFLFVSVAIWLIKSHEIIIKHHHRHEAIVQEHEQNTQQQEADKIYDETTLEDVMKDINEIFDPRPTEDK